MNKLSKEQYINKNVNASKFITKEHLDILMNQVFNKFLQGFNNQHKKLWESTLNKLVPKNHLNFNNESDYLEDTKITKLHVINNSILYCLPDLEKNDVEYLINQFNLFTFNNKVKILTKSNTPIYIEIIEVLNYIKSISQIISKYPKYNGNHYGTKHRQSSKKSLLTAQLNTLKSRLDGRFFTLENEEEIKKTKTQIKFIEYSLKKEYENLPEWLNFANTYLGFDHQSFNLTDIEILTFKQLTDFFNGIRTSKEELLKSVMIFLRIKSNIKNEDKKQYKELSESIINIVRFFFKDTILEVEKTKNKKTITYNIKNIEKEYIVKTYLSNTPIYTYYNKNTNDALNELITLGFMSMFGLSTIFDEEDIKNKEDDKEISTYSLIKALVQIKHEFNFTKKETVTLSIFLNYYFQEQIN
ncbi:hypothetical protein [Arcobacter roscoffensis]|uniref:Uncharacterized protein n=1 Tax=Arcobacter roscoffensis TaxID=2961520 RepID=A0ABY5E3B1_9BACT|nr:hypothetical protein [Arcobacter roscoffensis]UTJ06647.1 hypothetical protein NJU99_00730 [Arcobacter roscoffensis]